MADVVRGVPQFDNAISEMNARINKAAKEFVSQGGREIAARAKESINGSSNDKWQEPINSLNLLPLIQLTLENM